MPDAGTPRTLTPAESHDGTPVTLESGKRHTLVVDAVPVYEHLPLLIPMRYARLWNAAVPWRADLTHAEYERGLQRGLGGNPSTAGSRFMSRISRDHNGIDIYAPVGTPVYAAFAGVVTRCVSRANYDGNGGGYRVYIRRRGRNEDVWYFHLSEVGAGIRLNAAVTAGQVIGLTGVTGNAHPSDDPRREGLRDGSGREPHLHLERHVGGAPVNPANGLPMQNWIWER